MAKKREIETESVEKAAAEGVIEVQNNTPDFVPLKKDEMKLTWIKFEDIDPNPDNANEMDSSQFQELVDSIRQVGFTDPVQVRPFKEGEAGYDPDRQRYQCVAGEHRLEALPIALPDWGEAPCIVNASFTNQDAVDMTMVRNNVVHGDLNKKKFTKIVDRLMPKYGKELTAHAMGFATEAKMEEFLIEYAKNQVPEGEAQKEIVDKIKRKKIKTMEDLSRVINQLIAKYGNTIEQDFMYFNYGGHTHLMISMRRSTKAIMDEVTTHCAERKININDLMERIITKGWDRTLLTLKGEETEEGDPFEEEDEESDDSE